MPLDISSTTKATSNVSPLIVVYGLHGLGKTTFASEFPAPLYLPVGGERPPVGIEIDSPGEVTTYDDILDVIGQLYTDPGTTKTLIIDSLDKLEPLVWAKACALNNWKTIETPGFGKGYTFSDGLWQDMLEGCIALRAYRGITTILIAHAETERFDDPTSVSYSRYDMRLHKRARAIVQDTVDGIFFINKAAEVKAEDLGFNKTRNVAGTGDEVWLYPVGKPAFNAKNRFNMPSRLMLVKGQGYAAVKRFLPTHA